MHEARSAHEALGRIVAERDSLDGRQISIPSHLAEARGADLAGFGDRAVDALGRGRVGRRHVGFAAAALAEQGLPHRGRPSQRLQEARRRVGVVAGSRDGVDADPVRFEFLRP